MSTHTTTAAPKTEWQTTRLLDVTRHHSGNGKLIKGKLNDAPADGLFPAYSASGQDVWRDGFEHEGDAIIVSAVGARCGKCFLASGKWSAVANTHVVWPDADKIDRKFLWYRVNDERFWERSGSAQPFVVVRKTFERDFLLPPLPEQRRIVAEIEKQFTRLEAGVAALRRVQANLKRYRAAVLKAACEGQLVPTEAELHRQRKTKSAQLETGAELLTRILAERRKNWTGRGQYKEPAAPDSANLPPLPEGWTWASIEQITENFDGRRVPLKSADRDKRSGQYPYYGASGVIDDIDDFLFDGDFLLIAEDGANLLSRSTPIAFKASGKFWVNNHAHIVQMHGGIPLAYLEVFLNGKDLTFSVTGSAQPKLTQAAMNKIQVPLPPLAEQTRIVAEVERRLSVVEELESVVSANLQRATRLRQSILQKAFTGELTS